MAQSGEPYAAINFANMNVFNRCSASGGRPQATGFREFRRRDCRTRGSEADGFGPRPPPHQDLNNNHKKREKKERRFTIGSDYEGSCRLSISNCNNNNKTNNNNINNNNNVVAVSPNRGGRFNRGSTPAPATGRRPENLPGQDFNVSRRRWLNPRLSTDCSEDLRRRLFGLMERYVSRAHLFKIMRPPVTPNSDPCLGLSCDIWNVFCETAQTEDTYLRKLDLWKSVHFYLRNLFSRFSLFMVGSTMSGLSTETSDIDMCLLVKQYLNDARSDALEHLRAVQLVLLNCGFVTAPEIIQAKVPILKFRDARHGFEVDLNCNNSVGIRNTHLLHCYAYLDWRVRPLVVVVKRWARANDINDAKRMTISSYSLTLMVIHYLQYGVHPPVVPCLQALYPDKFAPDLEIRDVQMQEELPQFASVNRQSLGELLLGFFGYYAHFDYERHAVTVRERGVLPKDRCRHVAAPKNDAAQWKLLCIEEPFELTNTARSVYDPDAFERVKAVFKASYRGLRKDQALGTVVPVLRHA